MMGWNALKMKSGSGIISGTVKRNARTAIRSMPIGMNTSTDTRLNVMRIVRKNATEMEKVFKIRIKTAIDRIGEGIVNEDKDKI